MTNTVIGMRDNEYRHLLGSRVWKRMRAEYLGRHPLCEDCEAKGITRLATEVHHIIPICNESSPARMRALAYDANNLRALCHECHEKAHEAMGSRLNKKAIRARHSARAAAFIENFLKPSSNPPRGE